MMFSFLHQDQENLISCVITFLNICATYPFFHEPQQLLHQQENKMLRTRYMPIQFGSGGGRKKYPKQAECSSVKPCRGESEASTGELPASSSSAAKQLSQHYWKLKQQE
ncbi:uncharacterized protein LOC117652517 [Thrips palmi]|uniref:Uncharacterized protein LOC117652517 n=1 Tax=Thrips palmi TaxID=161013 RepID=A0A6P9A7T2_THRPL|nr:uncharacterized protein LOC117652517 [Thrips palmi]